MGLFDFYLKKHQTGDLIDSGNSKNIVVDYNVVEYNKISLQLKSVTDSTFVNAAEVVVNAQQGSTSLLQKKLQ